MSRPSQRKARKKLQRQRRQAQARQRAAQAGPVQGNPGRSEHQLPAAAALLSFLRQQHQARPLYTLLPCAQLLPEVVAIVTVAVADTLRSPFRRTPVAVRASCSSARPSRGTIRSAARTTG
jgi:hypothetical protein